jgi:hypothetical protein
MHHHMPTPYSIHHTLCTIFCAVERESDGDEWIQRHELTALLKNLYFFHELWAVFDAIGTVKTALYTVLYPLYSLYTVLYPLY